MAKQAGFEGSCKNDPMMKILLLQGMHGSDDPDDDKHGWLLRREYCASVRIAVIDARAIPLLAQSTEGMLLRARYGESSAPINNEQASWNDT